MHSADPRPEVACDDAHLWAEHGRAAYMGGATGAGHSAEFRIVDEQLGYIQPAKALASMAIDLLADGGTRAREVIKTAKPPMTREGYLAYQRGIARREHFNGAP